MAAKAGLDVEQMYHIVKGAAGASWMFTDRGKRMLSSDNSVESALDIFVKDLDMVYAQAKALQIPIPIASVALQQFISGQSLGLGKCDDSQVVKVYEYITGAPVALRLGEKPSDEAVIDSSRITEDTFNITVIGIGAMGGGMARALLRSPISNRVTGYDRSHELVEAFFHETLSLKKAETLPPSSLSEAVNSATHFSILSLVNEMQCEQVCFGESKNLLGLMSPGSCVILTSTVTGK